MLKTNSKAVREKVRAYILENATIEYQDAANQWHERDAESFAEARDYIIKCFTVEHWNRDYIRNMTKEQSFESWASGLAMGSMFLYYYNVNAVDLVGGILEETERERERWSESDAEHLMTYLIYREIFRGLPMNP